MTALHDLSATELVARYRERSLSPVEVTRAVLDRIAAWEPHLHATYALDPDAALASARVSEARWLRHVSAGENVGALEGVPAMIKENIATTGTPLPLGTAATELAPAQRDAPPAARLREAGAVVLGKTTMPDYGMLSSGLSSFHGLTRNPWDLSKNPGGSSSGAAAGVAAGYGPLHLGTDIGGSVRLPAGWCGVFTLKPSLGRIPIDPPYAGRVAGPMTRTVADAALMMGVLAQPDDRDTMSLPAQSIDWQRLERDVAGLRIGLMMDAGVGLPVDAEIAAAVEAAAKQFEAAGARRRADRAVHDARHARRHGRLLAHARLARHLGAARGAARAASCRSSSPGRSAARRSRASASFAATARWRRCARPRSPPAGPTTSSCRRPRRSPPTPPSCRRRPTTPSIRSSTSPSRSPTT